MLRWASTANDKIGLELKRSGAVFKVLKKFLKSESGATAIEYALIASLVSVAIVGGATSLGTGVNTSLNNASSAFSG